MTSEQDQSLPVFHAQERHMLPIQACRAVHILAVVRQAGLRAGLTKAFSPAAKSS